jgi:hypothetical protein
MPRCTEKCTRVQASIFSLKVDKRVLNHPEALTIGHLSAVTTTEELSAALQQVPEIFWKWINIMTKYDSGHSFCYMEVFSSIWFLFIIQT